MKRILVVIVSWVLCLTMMSQEPTNWKGVYIHPAKMVRDGSKLNVELDLNLSQLDPTSERVVILTPYLMGKEHRLELKSVGIYGKHRYLHVIRQHTGMMMTGENELSFRASKKPDRLAYTESIDYEPWMEDSQLMLRGEEYGCCRRQLDQQILAVGAYQEIHYRPQYLYVSPKVEAVKNRSLSGHAFIEFLPAQTVIRSAYRNNQRELDKIIQTIQSVKSDTDISIRRVTLKGFASPEGNYKVNEHLAQKRVEALRNYVVRLYPQQQIQVDCQYEAEDWQGLRAYVTASSIANQSEVLEIIDQTIDADQKEQVLKTRYPVAYKQLLTDCYPTLRRSDYQIDYVVKSYTDINEIKRLIKEDPKKLSLQEFYQAAQTYPLGSDDFNLVFQTAVAIYPTDETANMNAANTAMARGDLKTANYYLQRAGNSKEAIYARGIYEALSKNYDKSIQYFEQAQHAGITEAETALTIMHKLEMKHR